MYISSFNVNSINARINNLIGYLNNFPIDIILLQEIKSVEENFPYKTFEDLGYNIYANCQKSYNGVAVLSKFEMTNTKFSFFDKLLILRNHHPCLNLSNSIYCNNYNN